MRVLLALSILPFGLAACTSGAPATVSGQPTATDDALSLSVVAVEPGRDKTTVEMVVVNGGSRPETVSREYTPMSLVDGEGAEHAAAGQTIEVPAYSSDRIRVEFAGRAAGAQMTLTAGDLTVPNLPTAATRFDAGAPAAGSLAAVQANHTNGSSVRVTGVTFGDTGTSVQVEAVNGHDREIKLSASTGDPTHLADETGRMYPFVPPAANPDLSVAAGQVMRGTLQFAGHVPASTKRLTLGFNTRYGSASESASNPSISLDVPLAPPPAE